MLCPVPALIVSLLPSCARAFSAYVGKIQATITLTRLVKGNSAGNRMKQYLIATAMIAALMVPASAQLSSQQQRMKDCNTQASGMSGDARKQFMSSCLSGAGAETKGPHCTKGKPCGNSCIAMDKVCHK
jgi:hypothetical protein